MYSKLFTETLSESDKIVFTLLEISRSVEEYTFFKEVRDFDFSVVGTQQRIALIRKLNELVSFTRGDPTEFWKTFEPSLSFNRFWMDKKKLAPVSRIGVGYKDKGSLGGSSFDESPPKEEVDLSVWNEMILFTRLSLNLPLPSVPGSSGIRYFPPRSRRQADEPQRAKRK